MSKQICDTSYGYNKFSIDGQMHPQTFDALKPFGGAIVDTRQLQINTGSSASKLTFYQHHYFLGSKLASNFHNKPLQKVYDMSYIEINSLQANALTLRSITVIKLKVWVVGTGSNVTQGHTPRGLSPFSKSCQ